MRVHAKGLLLSITDLFYMQNAEFFDFYRVPIETIIFTDSTKHVLLQNTHTS